MRVYIHTQNNREYKEVTVESDTTIGSLIKNYLPTEASSPDFEEDLEVFKQDESTELSKDSSIKSAHIHDGCHLHFSRCKKVATEIKFNGQHAKHNFTPSTTIGVVLKWAINHFKVDPDHASHLALFLSEIPDSPIPNDTHLGSLTGFPACGVTLYLSKKKTHLG